MKQLLIFGLLLLAGCVTESKPLPVFEYHGVRLGEPIPAELKAKCKVDSTYYGAPKYIETITGETSRQKLTVEYWELNGTIERVSFDTKDTTLQYALDDLMNPLCVKLKDTYSKDFKISGGTLYRKGIFNDNWDIESDKLDDFARKQTKESEDKAKALIK